MLQRGGDELLHIVERLHGLLTALIDLTVTAISILS